MEDSQKEDKELARRTRPLNTYANFLESTCFFCGELQEQPAQLDFSNDHILTASTELCDEKWLSKLSHDNIVVIERKDHTKYLTKLCVRDLRSHECKSDKACSLVFGIVLSDILSYIRYCQYSNLVGSNPSYCNQ